MTRHALLLDIDGTLVDSNDAHVSAWSRAFAEHGYDIPAERIYEQIGKGGDNLLPSILPDAPEEEQAAIEHAHGEIYQRGYLPKVKAFPGASEFIRHAHSAGMKVVLASSASRAELDHYVDLLGVREALAATTSTDDVAQSKPAPDIFAAALAKVAPVTPAQALVIGDTPYDIAAARRVGIDAIGLRSGGFSDASLRREGATGIYDGIADLILLYEAWLA